MNTPEKGFSPDFIDSTPDLIKAIARTLGSGELGDLYYPKDIMGIGLTYGKPENKPVVEHTTSEQLAPNIYNTLLRTSGAKAKPYAPPAYPVPKEITPALHASLWQHAESLVLVDCAVPADGKDCSPEALQDYQFVPVLSPDRLYLTHSINSAGYEGATSDGIHFEYKGQDGVPYMDGRVGLGLVFQGRLVALCTGGLAQEGPTIKQIQDVSSKTPPSGASRQQVRSFRFKNGLHSTLDWKPTLVRGWCALLSRALPDLLPDTVGMPVWIQSAENNTWVTRQICTKEGVPTGRYKTNQERLPRFTQIYDGTAYKLGAVEADPRTRNFVLPFEFAVGRASC